MRREQLQYWILAVDLAWIAAATIFLYDMRYGTTWYSPSGRSLLSFIPVLLVTLPAWSVIFARMKLDGFRRGWHLPAIFSQLFLAVCFLVVVLLAIAYLDRDLLSRVALIYFGCLLFLGLVTIRFVAHAVLESKSLRRRRVVIVGNGPVAHELAAKIEIHPEMLCQVIGFLSPVESAFDHETSGFPSAASRVQSVGVIKLLQEQRADEVIITLSRLGRSEVVNLANQCREEGIGVSVVPHPYELYLSKPRLLDFGGLPVLQLNPSDGDRSYTVWKRAFDLSLGSLFLLISIPLTALGAMTLLGKKSGPFCRELRCGQFGKQFWMLRLNSNRDSDNLSKWERVLQQLSITELPQLWNVLRGDMSLVGPRPESPERVKHYSEWQRQRLNVKPGMTGLAQVHGLREQHSSEEKARFDLQYMLHPSLLVDLALLLQTVWTLLGRVLRLGVPRSEDKAHSSIPFEGRLPGAHSTQSSAD